MNREAYEALRAIDGEIAAEYACLPDADEYTICAVDHNTGMCRIAHDPGSEQPSDWLPLDLVRFKDWRNASRKPGYPGDIVELVT